MEFFKCLLRKFLKNFLNDTFLRGFEKMNSSNFKQNRIAQETRGQNYVNTEKSLINTNKFLMSFSRKLGNHNYHPKGLSRRKILIKIWICLIQHSSQGYFESSQEFIVELYLQKIFIVNKCMPGSSGLHC